MIRKLETLRTLVWQGRAARRKLWSKIDDWTEDASFLVQRMRSGRALERPPTFKRRVQESMKHCSAQPDDVNVKLIRTINHKLNAYRLVEHLASEHDIAIRVPQNFIRTTPIHEVDPDVFGPAFVLKPLWGAANRGVFLLERQGKTFYDAVRKRHFTWTEVREQYCAERERLKPKHQYSLEVFAEEWVQDENGRGPIPLDYRMYSFFGEVGLIQQRDCNLGPRETDRRFRYYDRDWNDLGPIRGAPPDLSLRPPPLAGEGVRIAERISRQLPLPFIRVDLYLGRTGIYFGEFTPHPGSYARFNMRTNRRLGELWARAEWRLERSQPFDRDRILQVLKGDVTSAKV